MLQLTRILGHVSDADLSDRLQAIAHAGGVETIQLARADAPRHRLRTTTDRGTDVAIALDRHDALSDGAVLYLVEGRAIVVRMPEEAWLTLAPRDLAAALELGYHAGNLHWRVRFAAGRLQVALEGPEPTYTDRLGPLLASGRVRTVPGD